jgi:phosphatidate cytidylyltransferase
MLADRVKVVLILLPIGLVVFYLGGIIYLGAMTLVLCLAAFEYANLFREGSLEPSRTLVVASTAALMISRGLDEFASAPWLLTLIIFITMSYHLLQYERGRGQAGTDFAVTLSGSLYFGWLGAYLVSIRQLPDGLWWLLLTLGCVWIGDSGAYLIGKNFGTHRMSPRLSPKKSWEGFAAEVVTSVLGGLLLAWMFGRLSWSSPTLQPWHGAVLGLLLAVFTPLGDLGESMVKRQMGVKDSSNLLPGHGGAWDRIDSWLWAAALGYYLIIFVFLPAG